MNLRTWKCGHVNLKLQRMNGLLICCLTLMMFTPLHSIETQMGLEHRQRTKPVNLVYDTLMPQQCYKGFSGKFCPNEVTDIIIIIIYYLSFSILDIFGIHLPRL